MTTLKKTFDEEFAPRKRAKHTGEFRDCSQEAARYSHCVKKRKLLDETYEENRFQLQHDIETNIEQQVKKKRKPIDQFEKTFDEETVRQMISIALDTQKEKLFETFIEQNLDDYHHFEQVIHALFDEHALKSSLYDSYIN